MKIKRSRAGFIRRIVQISVFVFVLTLSVGKWLGEIGVALPFLPNVSLHAVCPFGGVVTIYEFMTTGTFIQKIHSASFILMILGLLAAILFGAVFCGYICPFGSLQEWIGKLGKKLFPRKFNHIIPHALDRVLRYLRYVILLLVVYQTAVSAKLLFESMDPYYALFHFFTGEVAFTAYAALVVTMLLSLIIERPWCKYFCPYGALLGLFNPIRIFKLKRNKETCIGCKKCDRACPMNLDVSGKEVIRNHQCISCHKCTSEESCPAKDTVTISA